MGGATLAWQLGSAKLEAQRKSRMVKIPQTLNFGQPVLIKPNCTGSVPDNWCDLPVPLESSIQQYHSQFTPDVSAF